MPSLKKLGPMRLFPSTSCSVRISKLVILKLACDIYVAHRGTGFDSSSLEVQTMATPALRQHPKNLRASCSVNASYPAP